jgi:hypothetical protein
MPEACEKCGADRGGLTMESREAPVHMIELTKYTCPCGASWHARRTDEPRACRKCGKAEAASEHVEYTQEQWNERGGCLPECWVKYRGHAPGCPRPPQRSKSPAGR